MRAASVGTLFVVIGCTPAGSASSSGTPATSARPPATASPAAPARKGAPATKVQSPVAPETAQLVTVVSSAWTSVPATLQRYARAKTWSPVGKPIAVVLGKSGLGWGRGLHPRSGEDGPTKHEGDGRSPAGVFALGTAFGYAAPERAEWLSLPYARATDDLECVDDTSSSHYNQLVFRSAVAHVDWTSSEHMKRRDSLYRWGVFVDHNTAPVVPGEGSCIFLHIWRGPESSTVGCTAGDETDMKEVFAWLDPAKHPVLVQLPRPVYELHAHDWALP
jgi:D-alanyl-D-alanine dipeptidase